MPSGSIFTLHRRAQTPNSTWGDLIGPDGKHLGLILERGLHNLDGHPRIPAGQYHIVTRPIGSSEFDVTLKAIIPNYQGILWLADVPNRTLIEIHPANYINQLLGCLAAATTIIRDANGDFMATASRGAYGPIYEAIVENIRDGVKLVVNDPPEGAIA